MATARSLTDTIKELNKTTEEKIKRLKDAVKDTQESRQKQTGQPLHQS